MKLITVTKAAERLGVHRQTVENWAKRGILQVKAVGRAHFVLEEEVNAIADIAPDVEHARQSITKELDDIKAMQQEQEANRRAVRRELQIEGILARALTRREFYYAIPAMLCELDIIPDRVAEVMRLVIQGETFEDIASRFGLSKERVRQLFTKGCRKATLLSEVKDKLLQLEDVRLQNAELKQQVKILSSELKTQREYEEALRAKNEAERIKAIEETDSLISLFNTPITDPSLNLSVRTLNCCKSSDIETLGDICRHCKTDFLKMRNFGRKSLSELDDLLDSLNLSFLMDVDAIYRQRIAQRIAEIKEQQAE